MTKPRFLAVLIGVAMISAAASSKEPETPKAAPLPDTYLADYARRLQTEMNQLQAQYSFDQQALQELIKEQEAAKPKEAKPVPEVEPEKKPK